MSEDVRILAVPFVTGVAANESSGFLGFADVHLVRKFDELKEGKGERALQGVLEEAQALLRGKAKSMGGNTVIAYSVDSFNLRTDEYSDMVVYISVSGDVLNL